MTTIAGRSPDTVDTVLLKELANRVEAADADSRVEVSNAMTGRPLEEVPRCTSDDVATAAERARAMQPAWAARPIRERAAVLLRFHDLVLQHQDEVLDLIQLENGKARRHAFEEILDVCLTARYFANTAAGYLSPKRRQGAQLMLTRSRLKPVHHFRED
jgi:succinate-semialdehyde dehydrogenase/glutarate-semialdehyde dehydrogenase